MNRNARLSKAIFAFLMSCFLFPQSLQATQSSELARSPFLRCERIENIPGPEDIEMNLKEKWAVISSSPRREPHKNGQLYYWNLAVTNQAPEPLLTAEQIQKLGAFNPHGMSLLRWEGRDFIFAINHVSSKETHVEKFELKNKELLHLQTYTSPEYLNANDIAGESPSSFALTQDHSSRSLFGKLFKDLSHIHSGKVIFYDNGKISSLKEKFYYSNGIIFNSDKSRLYVSSTLGRSIDFFEKSPLDSEWKLKQHFLVPGYADNLSWNDQGDLVVALQTTKYKFLAHALTPKVRVGSHIAKIRVNPEGFLSSLQSLFYDARGEFIAGSSVGIEFEDELLLGSVFDNFALRCRKVSNF